MTEEEKKERLGQLITTAKELLGEITKPQLVLLAEELTDMMQINDPPLKTTGTVDEILAEIVEAGTLLFKGDTLSTEAINILSQVGLAEFIKKAGIKIPEEEVDEEPEDEQQEQKEEKPEQDGYTQYDDGTEDEPGEEEPEEEEPEEEEPEPEDVQEHDEHVDDAVVVEETIPDGTLASMTPDELFKMLEKRVEVGRKINRKATPDNPSTYMIAFEIICQFPDLTLKELNDAVAKKGDLEITPKNLPGIRTARSVVQKVVSRLREHGLVTAKGMEKKRTTKKPAAKK